MALGEFDLIRRFFERPARRALLGIGIFAIPAALLSSAFSDQLRIEREALQHGKVVFTEKAGVNCVILDSTDDLDKAMDNLAFSLTLYSGQMCTAPQNIFIAEGGMRVGDATVSAEEVALKLREKIDALVFNEKAGILWGG